MKAKWYIACTSHCELILIISCIYALIQRRIAGSFCPASVGVSWRCIWRMMCWLCRPNKRNAFAHKNVSDAECFSSNWNMLRMLQFDALKMENNGKSFHSSQTTALLAVVSATKWFGAAMILSWFASKLQRFGKNSYCSRETFCHKTADGCGQGTRVNSSRTSAIACEPLCNWCEHNGNSCGGNSIKMSSYLICLHLIQKRIIWLHGKR